MIVLPPLDVLVDTYRHAVDASQVVHEARFNTVMEQTKKFQGKWETEEPEGKDLDQVQLVAVINMGRDLGFHREQGRNTVDGLADGRFSTEQAIEKTNSTLGQLTGLRKFLQNLDLSGVSDVEHAKADVRVEVLQEEIATKLIRALEAKESLEVTFNPDKGGIVVA